MSRPCRTFLLRMKYLLHIVRKGRGEVQFLTINRMGKGETAGVESLPLDSFHIRIVQIIPNEGCAEAFEMDADLVCPPGFQHEAQKRIISVNAFYMIVCNSSFTMFPVCRAFNHRTGLRPRGMLIVPSGEAGQPRTTPDIRGGSPCGQPCGREYTSSEGFWR